jgi:hypothetical protein
MKHFRLLGSFHKSNFGCRPVAPFIANLQVGLPWINRTAAIGVRWSRRLCSAHLTYVNNTFLCV